MNEDSTSVWLFRGFLHCGDKKKTLYKLDKGFYVGCTSQLLSLLVIKLVHFWAYIDIRNLSLDEHHFTVSIFCYACTGLLTCLIECAIQRSVQYGFIVCAQVNN